MSPEDAVIMRFMLRVRSHMQTEASYYETPKTLNNKKKNTHTHSVSES